MNERSAEIVLEFSSAYRSSRGDLPQELRGNAHQDRHHEKGVLGEKREREARYIREDRG